MNEDCIFTFNNCEENSIDGLVKNILLIQCYVKEQYVNSRQIVNSRFITRHKENMETCYK